MQRPDKLVLVNQEDVELGTASKSRVHREGTLHRAFSVFVFDSSERLLLQRRSARKYHSGGLWSNTCCSHPRPGEPPINAAHRRLREEMGFDCPLLTGYAFVYRAELGNGLTEHEYDHVLVGRFCGRPMPNPREVAAWKWEHLDTVRRDIAAQPEFYTEWFKIALERIRGASPSHFPPKARRLFGLLL